VISDLETKNKIKGKTIVRKQLHKKEKKIKTKRLTTTLSDF